MRARIPSASWIPAENLHCTIKFLGRVADDQVDDIARAVEAALSTTPSYATALTALGAFPTLRRARVVWAGLDDEFGATAGIAAAVDAALVPLGFARDDRAFRAHVTLARLRVPGPVSLDVAVSPVAFAVERITLFRSHLGQGPGRTSRYEAVARASLAERP